MLLDYRIRKQQIKLDKQNALVEMLSTAEREYNFTYYTDKLHDAVCARIEIESKLKWLQDKKKDT